MFEFAVSSLLNLKIFPKDIRERSAAIRRPKSGEDLGKPSEDSSGKTSSKFTHQKQSAPNVSVVEINEYSSSKERALGLLGRC